MLESKAGSKAKRKHRQQERARKTKKQAVGRASATSFREVIEFGLVFLISNFKSEI
jgi:hypothetical protein